ncbi:hypothetical protein VPH35_124468 [Triticum aestivum]|nr:uncharacterized protein LOC123148276 [Triticum aestivum]
MIDLIRSGHRLPGPPTGSLALLSYHPWFRHGAQPTARMQTALRRIVYNPGPVASIRTRASTHARITLLSGAAAAVPATRARAYVHMGEEVASTAAAPSSLMAAAAVKGDEERYAMVASRFFRVKPGAGGAAALRPHFLDSCFLCKRSISRDRDIFMYRGDAAFCGEECRQDQMAMDEALNAAARRHRKQAAAEQAAGTARREEAGATAASMMHRRPTIANLGAVARTPVAAS